MEKPYYSRAIISETEQSLVITIPTKEGKLMLLFIVVWLFLWALGGVIIVYRLIEILFNPPFDTGYLLSILTVFSELAIRDL
jgi:hypothetical protein